MMYRYSPVLVATLFIYTLKPGIVFSANWIMLQGTEHPLAESTRFWGFIQPGYTNDRSNDLSGLTSSPVIPPDFSQNNGKRVANTTIAPWFDDDEAWHVRRAKYGVRGIFTGSMRNSFTSKMNYFAFVEFGSNLATYDPFGERARLVALDNLSLTFNHLAGARIRLGLFKTPGPEETLQAVTTLDFIELTDFSAREVLERFTTGAAQPAASPLSPTLGTPVNTAYGFNAVRDWGVQVFDSFLVEGWDLTYAVMAGRGEGVSETSNHSPDQELYLYASFERLLQGGKGPYRHGLKFFSWYQKGKRQFITDPANNIYERLRYGVGAKLLGRFFQSQYKYRLTIESMRADGMIFLAPAGSVANGAVGNGNLQIAADKGNRARGQTIDFGFYPSSAWQFDLRYHQHDLLYEVSNTVNPGNERIIEEKTVGVNYHLSSQHRLTLNYIFRDVKAPTQYTTMSGLVPVPVVDNLNVNVATVTSTIEDRVSLQLTWIF